MCLYLMILHVYYSNIHKSLSMMSIYGRTVNLDKFLSTVIILLN